MFSRSAAKGVSAAKSIVPSRSYNVANFKRPTMAELPVPQGSWEQWYNARQRQNNGLLIGGAVALVGTFTVFTQSGIITDFGRGPKIGVNEE
ncbi:hypothetical protein Anas_04117 [Armadillidium nasatum]|uniref:Deltamethrin resistance protein prag01 domain-containing protein n=1 Tax=Armadillidium nasatum TaxID=96803 RepID=A0A5N5TCG3_9CRUS|nr:hypothetical protein Anas_04117 [Armadillidium nasatum]